MPDRPSPDRPGPVRPEADPRDGQRLGGKRRDGDRGGGAGQTEGGLAPVVASALARVSRPDFDAWQAAVRAAGCCARPVRLSGRVFETDPTTGEVTVAYSSSRQPDRVLLKACGTRRATICPACASVYRGDAKTLLRGGLNVDDDRDGAAAPVVFVTLTAPSYGPVHAHRDGKRCRPGRPGTCRHGRQLGCDATHDRGDSEIGYALCIDCYDWDGAVIFNARAGELWRRTMIAAARTLAAGLGIPVRRFTDRHRLEYAKVVEFQTRGLVHVHALCRLDFQGPDHRDIDRHDGGTGVDGRQLATAMVTSAARVKAPNPLPGRPPLVWGVQVDAAVIPPERRRAAAAYLAKYAIKSVDGAGLLDRRLTQGSVDGIGLPDQLARMAATAWALGGNPSLSGLRLRWWAHTLGYRGHWLTKSKGWSTTFAELRARRQRWMLAEAGVDPTALDRRHGEWHLEGVGHLSAGDAWLAASANNDRRDQRRAAWQEP
jgi:hypothetical protein